MNLDKSVKQQVLEALSLHDTSVTLSNLKYIKSLGCGNFGAVCLVHNDKYLYAMKYGSHFFFILHPNSIQYCFNEKNIMLKTDNPFIIKPVKTFKNDDYLFHLLEFVDGISFRNHLEKETALRSGKEKRLCFMERYCCL